MAIEGWRRFYLTSDRMGVVTIKGSNDYEWLRRDERARCLGEQTETRWAEKRVAANLRRQRARIAREHMMTKRCMCGLYAYSKPAYIENPPQGLGVGTVGVPVYAEVIGWGVVDEHAKGFRSEFQRIKSLWLPGVPDDMLWQNPRQQLRERYGVALIEKAPPGLGEKAEDSYMAMKAALDAHFAAAFPPVASPAPPTFMQQFGPIHTTPIDDAPKDAKPERRGWQRLLPGSSP